MGKDPFDVSFDEMLVKPVDELLEFILQGFGFEESAKPAKRAKKAKRALAKKTSRPKDDYEDNVEAKQLVSKEIERRKKAGKRFGAGSGLI